MVRTPRRQTFPPTRPTGSYLRREIAIQAALEKKLAELEAERAAQREADRLADEAFTKEFLAAAMEVFRLLDTDESMSLDHDEFVGGVAHNPMVKNFLKDCGNEFLQELLIPSRLDKAMRALDTDGSGVIEIEEWYGARRPVFRLSTRAHTS